MLSFKAQTYFTDYAAAHRHPKNQRTHQMAIPLIVFHSIAMLQWIALGPITLAHVVCAVAIAWYATLGLAFALAGVAMSGVCLMLAPLVPKALVVVSFIAAWILQLAGHVVFEKNRPAFMHNIRHALIGPVFFLYQAWPWQRVRKLENQL